MSADTTTKTYAPEILEAALYEFRAQNLWLGRWPNYDVIKTEGGYYAIMTTEKSAQWVDGIAQRILEWSESAKA